jgi:Cu-processing system permease protein
MKAILWIAWIAARELFYERVFYLLAAICALALGLSFMLGQLTYAEQSKLTVDFLLGGIEISMILFSIFMGISLFHRELALGSISMVLSKPVSRTSFLLGKYLGQIGVQLIVIAFMGAVTLLACLRFEQASYLAITQTLALFFLEITVVTAVTYFFAVVAGGVTTALAALCFFCLGHLRPTVSSSLREPFAQGTWAMVKGLVPDLEIFNMKALASYGHTISTAELGWAALYALCCLLFFLGGAALFFERRDILT